MIQFADFEGNRGKRERIIVLVIAEQITNFGGWLEWFWFAAAVPDLLGNEGRVKLSSAPFVTDHRLGWFERTCFCNRGDYHLFRIRVLVHLVEDIKRAFDRVITSFLDHVSCEVGNTLSIDVQWFVDPRSWRDELIAI